MTIARGNLAGLAERLDAQWSTPHSIYGWFATVDHKKIGIRYLITAFVFLLLGGTEAALMRAQLARPDGHIFSPEVYDQLFTMHGTTMIFWYASPMLSGFGNYLVPLLIGSRDMAFPRLNAFSYWSFVLSGVFVYVSFLAGAAPHGGWFAYVPYTDATYSPGLNMDFYALALLFLTISTTVGAINFVVTIFTMRAPGMSLSRMPLMMWSTLTTSVASIFALPSLTAALIFLELERRVGFRFFDATGGGTPLLWQHLFWVFGHPWVYIIVLPATGMASMMFPTFCRRPIVGHTYIALATVSTGLFGFGVWAHHMFATGMPLLSTTFFSAASMAVSVPSGMQVFAWLATIWAAKRHVYSTTFLFLLGFLLLFVIGGVSGVMTASVPYDWQVTDTYFVVAHLHYVLVGINLFPVIAAFYYWLPKMTGRLLNERLGRWNFWVMFLGANLTFFPMHFAGVRGMPRRIYTYPAGMGWDWLNMLETIGAAVFVVGILLFIINVIWSLRAGAPAGDNPWGASSLEWSTTSPPPEYNFDVIPVVRSREPLWDAPSPSPEASIPDYRVLDTGRRTLGTTVLDGQPQEVLRMPGDSLWPLAIALALAAMFTAVLLASVVAIVITGILVLACAGGWLWPQPEGAAS
ncbi:MAG TPA: cytochrome c oxidase subunit I [Gemmatimonadaceae bacterium]